MRRFLLFLLLTAVATLAACNIQQISSITPAANKLTFLFFYTDG